jgi:cyclic pyranopterin phosphate synthase
MRDHFGRDISYLRVAVTDRCNLRCTYCMPPEGVTPIPHEEILRFEEIVRLVSAAVPLGITNVRFTGGEPLVRRDIVDLVRAIRGIDGIQDLSLTTNGTLLAKHAQELADAGLSRLNISLDSLKPERFKEITRGGDLGQVFIGIAKAAAAGLRPIKVNMVVVRGFNDDEILDMAKLTLDQEIHVRFIELMSIGESSTWTSRGYVPSAEMLERLAPLHPEPVQGKESGLTGSGPAKYYRLAGAAGLVGVITPVSNHFCRECNRLRLTADGCLRPCLLSDRQLDIKSALRAGASDAQLQDLIRQAASLKPEQQEVPRRPGAVNEPFAPTGDAQRQSQPNGSCSCGVTGACPGAGGALDMPYMSQIGG